MLMNVLPYYQIANLSASQESDKAHIQNLEEELNNLKKSYDEKNSDLENSIKELKLV